MSKKDRRKELAALSFSENIKILEKLRDRSRLIATAGLRRPAVSRIETTASSVSEPGQ
jgi:hypothetical protein